MALIGLASCAASGKPPLTRSLPAWPPYAEPVQVKEPQADDDAYAIAARERVGRVQANGRLSSARAWYEGVRKSYAGN